MRTLEFASYSENMINEINRVLNKSFSCLLLNTLFSRDSPLQESVFRAWFSMTQYTVENVKNKIKSVIYDVLIKPIELEMNGRYLQLFKDSDELWIPANCPYFYFAFALYTNFEPFFDAKTTIAPSALVHYTKYRYNGEIEVTIQRSEICCEFLCFFLNPSHADGYAKRITIVNSALRELFAQFQQMTKESPEIANRKSLSVVWDIAKVLGFTNQESDESVAAIQSQSKSEVDPPGPSSMTLESMEMDG